MGDWFGEGSVVSGLELVRDSDRQGHGQPSVCPWLSAWRAPSAFSCWGQNKTSLRKRGKPRRVPPCWKMTQSHIRPNRSGKDSLGPCQLRARRWGKCQCHFCLTVAGGGGAKAKQSNNHTSGLRSANTNRVSSPNWIRDHPNLNSQTDPVVSPAIKSTL